MVRFVFILCAAALSSITSSARADDNSTVTWTNGPATFRFGPAPPNEKAPQVFYRFLPESLNELAWTNLLAHTNAKSDSLWSIRTHPPAWPKAAPLVAWNTNCLIWGMRGLTALSPCWEDEGGSGQVPITALTRRHGYTRGHSMGADGVTSARNGKKVWFLTTNNILVEVVVKLALIRTADKSKQDYTIVLFNKDLPDSIEPISGVLSTDLRVKFPYAPGAPWPVLRTEQGGSVNAGLPGFSANLWKAGDSGSPDLLMLPEKLVFIGGRSTSGPSEEMQRDMNMLCRIEGLDPRKYQLNLLDVSSYPSY